MPRFMRATQRTRLLLVLVVAFAVLFICGVAEDNDRRSAVRSTLATLLEGGGGGGEVSSGNDALSVAAAPEELHRSQSVRQVVHGDSRSALVRGDSSASVAAIGMVHQESVEQRQNAAVWQGQAVTVVGLLGLTVFAVIVAVVGRKLYRSRRERRNGVSCVQQASPSSSTLALNGASRSRLFSRDRLNTTDYMHTLATLDRRLAMDEILEKRRRAVFLQQIRCHAPGDEDDVFLEEGLFCPEPAGGAPSSRHTTTPTNVDDTATASRMQHGATPLL